MKPFFLALLSCWEERYLCPQGYEKQRAFEIWKSEGHQLKKLERRNLEGYQKKEVRASSWRNNESDAVIYILKASKVGGGSQGKMKEAFRIFSWRECGEDRPRARWVAVLFFSFVECKLWERG